MSARQALGGPQLRVVAQIIRDIPEADVRQVVANHFGQALLRRGGSFDPGAWAGATGGRLTGPTRVADLKAAATA